MSTLPGVTVRSLLSSGRLAGVACKRFPFLRFLGPVEPVLIECRRSNSQLHPTRTAAFLYSKLGYHPVAVRAAELLGR